MTNEEAIEILKPLTEYSVNENGIATFPMVSTSLQVEALELAIQALKMRVSQELQTQLPDGTIYAPKLFNGCAVCDKCEVCPDAFCSHSVNCNAYGIPNFHKEKDFPTPEKHTHCVRCGRKLKDPLAQERGYGEVCWKKHLVDNQSKLF